MQRRGFYEQSMKYVLQLQEVQERKKFEFVEIVSITNEECQSLSILKSSRNVKKNQPKAFLEFFNSFKGLT